MGLVSKSIPNLINGVSQQPPSIRLDTQGEVQENGLSDVVDGLKKRPPTHFVKRLVKISPYHVDDNTDGYQNPYHINTAGATEPLTESDLDGAFFHTYKRDTDTQYQVIITKDKVIRVYDIHGNLRYESGRGSWEANGTLISRNTDNTDYLPTKAKQNITATSVADATFIVNKDKTVAMTDFKNPSNDLNQALVYLKSVNYGRQYTVKMTSKQNSTNANAGHTTTQQITTNSGNDDTVNSAKLKVSSVISETRNNNTCLREEIESALGAIDIDSFQGVISTGDISAFDATVSGFTLTAQNAEDGKYVVQVGGVTVPYRTNGGGDYDANGWHIVNDTTLRFPIYVIPAHGQWTMANQVRTRDAGRVVFTNNSTTTHGFVSPDTSNNEPYFIINTPKDSGDIRDFDIQVTDDDGGVNLKAFKGNAKSFTDLPNQCENGLRLGVVGDNQKKEDDFHVVFTGEAGAGYWKETVAYNLYNDFDLTTMPHTLRQLDDGGFKFSIAEDVDSNNWASRKAGDDNTNPAPSFVGQKITDIFFHRNRLGVLAGENVIFSEAGGYLNFWRTTVRTLLDSDPIDVSVSQNEVSELKAAVPIQDNLLLFSDLNQFTLSAAQLLTPAEVTIDQSTKYECDLTAPPVGAGTSVFFATQSGGFGGVREFITGGDTEASDAPEITSHVPKYIEGQITDMVASSNEDTLILLTDADETECYIYKWYNSSEERLQSSWSKWKFKKKISSVSFNNSTIFFTFKDGSYEEMFLSAISKNTIDSINDNILLDHKIVMQISEGNNIIDLYDMFPEDEITDDMICVTEEGLSLGAYDKTNITITNPVLAYLNTAKAISIGVPYTFKYQVSEQVFKPKSGDPTHLARFQLRKITFNYSNTGAFDVTIDSIGRSPSVSNFSARVLGTDNSLLDQAVIDPSGSYEVGVQSQPSTTKIIITSDSFLPCIFQSAEWEGFVTLRNQRL